MTIRIIHYGDEANREIDGLLSRNAALENALKFLGREVCEYRKKGQCLWGCQGILICETDGLEVVGGKNG